MNKFEKIPTFLIKNIKENRIIEISKYNHKTKWPKFHTMLLITKKNIDYFINNIEKITENGLIRIYSDIKSDNLFLGLETEDL